MKWSEWDIHDQWTPKGIVAQLAACVGPEVAKDMVVDFRR
jgi:hypothetical protein